MTKKDSDTPASATGGQSGRAARARFSEQALEKIAALDLLADPHIYEVWFRYFQGDAEVVAAVEKEKAPLDEGACHKIYHLLLHDKTNDDAVRKIGEQVHHAISELAGMLRSAKSATSGYADNLEGISKTIEGARTLEDLGAAVSRIVHDTREMMKKNQDLEFQLVHSSTQMAELRKNLDDVQREALTDGLTGLANRKAFDKKIQEWMGEAAVSGSDLCLLMLDIDRFKQFNDSYGHQTGDQVLRLVARTLIDGVKGRDFTGRFGGEEFVIMLPETPLEAAVRVAETLRHSVESKQVVNRANQETLGRITLSIGVAKYRRGEKPADFISRADAALYEAKNTGRNRVKTAS